MDREMELQYEKMGISPAVFAYGEAVLDRLTERFAEVDRVAEHNQAKVLHAMQKNRVNATCFAATTGYGYDDLGRDRLEQVYADCFHTEAALVRPQITCGTHALTVALSANLLPGDELLSPVGGPYDTLEEVIGIRESPLLAEGIRRQLPAGGFAAQRYVSTTRPSGRPSAKRRSWSPSSAPRAMPTRPTFSVEQIGELIAFCKSVKPDVICMVDNCYGEFVQTKEPTRLWARIWSSARLIKNPGGGLAPIGGYICGTKACVEPLRLPALGPGPRPGGRRESGPAAVFVPGAVFLAPTVVSGAIKGAIFAANIYESLGYPVIPNGSEPRYDIIQAVTLGSREAMLAFCKGIQAAAPVDSYVDPVPWAMPGYDVRGRYGGGGVRPGQLHRALAPTGRSARPTPSISRAA